MKPGNACSNGSLKLVLCKSYGLWQTMICKQYTLNTSTHNWLHNCSTILPYTETSFRVKLRQSPIA